MIRQRYPMPLETSDQDLVHVGRPARIFPPECRTDLLRCGDQTEK